MDSPPKLIQTDDFPDVAEYLRGCEGGCTAAIHLVLCEDTYESSHGDGVFRYPEVCFFDLDAAKKYEGEDPNESKKAEWYKYHIRPGVIWLDGDTIGYKVPLRIFDHFSGEEIMQLVTKAIELRRTEETPNPSSTD